MVLSHRAAHDAEPEGRAEVVVQCLGRFSVQVSGRPVTSWGAGKSRALVKPLGVV